MRDSPAVRPIQAAPGGYQARADGQGVEVRTYEGELVGILSTCAANELVQAGLADNLKHSVRLNLGIRNLTSRFDKPSGRPDLDQMRRRDPDRYKKFWQGSMKARVGKGALGRSTTDSSVCFSGTRKTN